MSALDLTSNSGRNGKQGTQGLKERVKDRKPPPIKLIKTIKNSDTLTTPDLAKAIQVRLTSTVCEGCERLITPNWRTFIAK